MPLSILFQDQDLIAIHKDSGFLVHKSLIDKHETQIVMTLLRDQIGQRVYPVHRLDKSASGVLLFARSSLIARKISTLFATSEVSKRYIAIVRGYAPETAHIDYALKEEPDPHSDFGARPDKPPQSAVTDIRRLATCELPFKVDRYPTTRYSLIEARPQTGRKHQIRRHLRHIGHPIIGDTSYGVGKHNRFFEDHFGIRRLLLACVSLEFIHPSTAKTICIQAELAPEMKALVKKLGWDANLCRQV